uniref:Conserved oligomeric Golgi complex subunit 8 n=1 Tax=Chromera velia CCMP2878 TaxID=1169474 RepID=A0A0G4HHP3_9ALVE|eukprot:Cvel_1049.t1-p1 / transcript=Cvel_1049.t1 / gene=Cvel_1049 / organism=Chromera_velia_CCMP2878 / gene_product=Conserved oligomeric Golgi complex subunit 8, putative / transcript_product=Conserved oligomeric Golgi complex subunit 8, putative / location=Cvel_scaffold34:48510-52980(-) / protein_length=780 / sequence_SO=supercontig / SO=protein_coding / is_pseudo=false
MTALPADALELNQNVSDPFLRILFSAPPPPPEGGKQLPQPSDDSPPQKHPLHELAQRYVPQLSACTCTKLQQEQLILERRLEEVKDAMEQLASANYGAFISSATTLTNMQEEMRDMSGGFEALEEALKPLEEVVQKFRAGAREVEEKRRGVKALLASHSTVLELLELPALLDTAAKGGQWEEGLELSAFFDNIVKRAPEWAAPSRPTVLKEGEVVQNSRGSVSGPSRLSGVLGLLQDQVEAQKRGMTLQLLGSVEHDVQLPQCVKAVNLIRKMGIFTETALRQEFLARRSLFVDGHKRQLEGQMESDPKAGLRNAADLLRLSIYDAAMHYRALFGSGDRVVSAWLTAQVLWFLRCLRNLLGPFIRPRVPDSQAALRSAKALQSETRGETWMRQRRCDADLLDAPLDAAGAAALFRVAAHSSASLKKMGCHFLPSVSALLEAFVQTRFETMLLAALDVLSSELLRYDWVPSTALGSGGGGRDSRRGSLAAGGGGVNASSHSLGGERGGEEEGQGDEEAQKKAVIRRSLGLTRHRPVALFTNGLVAALNELRQCAFRSIQRPACNALGGTLVEAVQLLGVVREEGSQRRLRVNAVELETLCENMQSLLLPLLAEHMTDIFGKEAKDDIAQIISAPVEGLLLSWGMVKPPAPPVPPPRPVETITSMPGVGPPQQDFPAPSVVAEAQPPTNGLHTGSPDAAGSLSGVPQTSDPVFVQQNVSPQVAQGVHQQLTGNASTAVIPDLSFAATIQGGGTAFETASAPYRPPAMPVQHQQHSAPNPNTI